MYNFKNIRISFAWNKSSFTIIVTFVAKILQKMIYAHIFRFTMLQVIMLL